MTCCVLAFTAPNSIYNINRYNNYIHMYLGNPNTDLKVYIPYGNYNSLTFMTQFVASVLSANSTLGTGLSITLNAVTNRFTVSHTRTSILFVLDSTISPVIGMNTYMSLGYSGLGSSNCLFPYTCNFTGIQNINIHITSMNTDNIDSLTKSDCNIVQIIPVDSNQSQITKTNDYAFTIKEDCIDSILVTTTDDLGESIDWNNQHWNLTLYFTTYQDIDRLMLKISFRQVLNDGC